MALLIPTILTQGIYSGFIGTVSTVTIKACTTLTSLSYFENPDLKKLLSELDIKYKLSILKSLLEKFDSLTSTKLLGPDVNDLEKSKLFELIKINSNLAEDPIKLCLLYMIVTINNIEKTLAKIRDKLNNHNKKWFSTWRHLNIEILLADLTSLSKQLDARFDNLVKVSNFIASLKN